MHSPSDPARGTAPGPRVAFFATCLADRFFADACLDAIRVLQHFGAHVTVPRDQTCCGQPAHNTGRREEAARMAVHTARVFADAEHVVLPSGSCAGMMRSFYRELLAPGGVAQGRASAARPLADRPPPLEDTPVPASPLEDPPLPDPPLPDATLPDRPLPDRTWELAQFLVHELRVLDRPGPRGEPSAAGSAHLGHGLRGRRIVYHHGCHALRELGVREEPLALLRACGAELVAWDGDTECCGFGGLFSTKFPEVSAGMADRKLDALPPEVGVVTSADGGCLLQLSGRWAHRLERSGAAGPAPAFVHLATLLREGLGL